jgi:hypothetical protein
MNGLEMLPDDYDILQSLLLKLNRDLSKAFINKGTVNLNGQTASIISLQTSII